MQTSPLSRHAIAAFPAVLCTLMLFYGMHALITLAPIEVARPHDISWPIFEPARKKDTPLQRETPPEPIPKPLPTPPTAHNAGPVDEFAIGISTRPTPPPGPDFGGGATPSLGDAPLVIVMRVQPHYPSEAIVRQLEGYATVEYDVAANGRTINHRIVDSTHRIFEKSAIRAAEQFRYQPRTVDGEPITTTGIRSRFRYEMDAR